MATSQKERAPSPLYWDVTKIYINPGWFYFIVYFSRFLTNITLFVKLIKGVFCVLITRDCVITIFTFPFYHIFFTMKKVYHKEIQI